MDIYRRGGVNADYRKMSRYSRSPGPSCVGTHRRQSLALPETKPHRHREENAHTRVSVVEDDAVSAHRSIPATGAHHPRCIHRGAEAPAAHAHTLVRGLSAASAAPQSLHER